MCHVGFSLLPEIDKPYVKVAQHKHIPQACVGARIGHNASKVKQNTGLGFVLGLTGFLDTKLLVQVMRNTPIWGSTPSGANAKPQHEGVLHSGEINVQYRPRIDMVHCITLVVSVKDWSVALD